MLALIELLDAWSWFIVGGLLLVLEVHVPRVFMLWPGLCGRRKVKTRPTATRICQIYF